MLALVGLSKSVQLTEQIFNFLETVTDYKDLVSITRFKDGELEVSFDQSIRGEDVFIIQSTIDGADSLMELCLAIDAAKRASARQVIAVIPYFGWARQDRKSKPRVSIGAKVVANMLQSVGCDRVITVDLHADQEQAFFDIPLDHVHASSVILDFLKERITENTILVAPDLGASKRVSKYAEALKLPMAVCLKVRNKPNQVEKITLIGDVKGKEVFVIDDMIDTAGTMCKVAYELYQAGASFINVIATHGVFSGEAFNRIYVSEIDKVYVTDTITPKQEYLEKIKVISVAKLLANVIDNVENNKSISELYSF